MKNYLFVLPSLSKGGAERVVSILANSLVEKGKKVTIIIHFDTKDKYYTDKKVKVVCLSNLNEEEYRKKINMFYLVKLLFDLRKNIKKEDPDYIIPFLWTTCIRTHIALLLTKYNKNVFHTVRNNPNVFPKNSFLKWYRNFLIKKSKITFVQNLSQKQYFNNASNIFVIPNPVSDDIFKIERKENDYVKIIGVGRLEKQKNFEMLIRAFSKVKTDKTKLVIYGEGTQKKYLEHLISELELNDNVILYGRCESQEVMYSDAKIFILSSNFEGMPNTLLEAMSVGIPCISTNCETGPKDIIINNKNGFLIPVNNVEELATKLNYLINDKKLRDKLGKSARTYIEDNYNSSKITSDFVTIWESEANQ